MPANHDPASRAREERSLLVLGARGLLGPWLVRAAREATRGSVWAASRGAHEIAAIERGVTPVALDVLRFESTAAQLVEMAPDAIVLCAALARMEQCRSEPARAEALNATLPGLLGAVALRLGARFVLVSTDLVFGHEPPQASGWREGDAPAPLSAYGCSKLRGELALRAAHPRALVARVPLLFGALHPASGAGASSASTALLTALARGSRPQLFGDEWRTPLEVESAARALIELAFSEHEGVLHLSTGERCSRFELGRALLARAGLDPAYVEPATRAARGQAVERPRDASLDGSRARKLLRAPLVGYAALRDAAQQKSLGG